MKLFFNTAFVTAVICLLSCSSSSSSVDGDDDNTDSIENEYEWSSFDIPANPGDNNVWVLQEEVSDDFNYEAIGAQEEKEEDFNSKWNDFYHNGWTGPAPTVWERENSYVKDGLLNITATRTEGEVIEVMNNGELEEMPVTNTGCISSKTQIVYPVYIEGYAKIMNSVLANALWLLSPDDTQEIDFLEGYGGDRAAENSWFTPDRVHVSHHVFIRDPFQDWQPHDEGSFYTDGSTVWRNDFHRYGVYWKDPWSLEYYIDGKLVRTRSGVDEIDPLDYTDGSGLNKPMDIIIDAEDQTWRAIQGLTPTTDELQNTDDNTFYIDWIRVYKPESAEM